MEVEEKEIVSKTELSEQEPEVVPREDFFVPQNVIEEMETFAKDLIDREELKKKKELDEYALEELTYKKHLVLPPAINVPKIDLNKALGINSVEQLENICVRKGLVIYRKVLPR